jgi:phosphoenolpyruvate carboxykinase (GTP)
VLAWVFGRVAGTADADETPIGFVPTKDALPTDGLDIPDDELDELLHVDAEEWKQEIKPIRDHLAQFGEKLPPELSKQVDALEERLNS